MKIQNSTVTLSSERSYAKETVKTESLNFWSDNDNASSSKEASYLKNDKLDLSPLSASCEKKTCGCEKKDDGIIGISDSDKLKIDLIERFCESVLGKKVKFSFAEQININASEMSISIDGGSSSSDGRVGWGFVYSKLESFYESEETSFNASAEITTQDGRKISIDMSVLMSRKYQSQTAIIIRGGDALKDPLVLNFGTANAEATQKKYSFDIDSDGVDDSISFVGKGSGFLALDKNGDGIINNGNELFGTQSGDGFGDLAFYDDDKNGWIDENDSIFDSLRVWTKDDEGNDYLFALAEKGIGAIYLGNANTEFSLNNYDNQTNAVIRKTGIFLFEDARAGTIQHIDLVV